MQVINTTHNGRRIMLVAKNDGVFWNVAVRDKESGEINTGRFMQGDIDWGSVLNVLAPVKSDLEICLA